MAKALNIVYHLNSVALGGMEVHADVLARAVAARGHRVSVILPELPVLDKLAAGLAAAGTPVHRLSLEGAQGRHNLIQNWLHLRGLLRELRPDLLHQHRTGPYHGKWACLAAKAAGVPVLVASEHQAPHPLHGAARQANRVIDRMVDAFVVVSDHDRQRQLQVTGRPSAKIARIYNGIDLGQFVPVAGPADAADAPPVIGTVSRLEEQKGLIYFLQAVPALAATWPNLTVLIAGHGSLRSALEAEAARLGIAERTQFLGFVPSPAEVLAQLQVVVIPSVWEPFGLVAAEALAMQRAIVATKVGGLQEVIVDGESGLLVPPENPAALAGAVDGLLRDPGCRKRLGVAGRRRVEALFSVDAMADNMLELYRRLRA
jgi:glycosyltransferase involved in cell wall biosynthesis